MELLSWTYVARTPGDAIMYHTGNYNLFSNWCINAFSNIKIWSNDCRRKVIGYFPKYGGKRWDITFAGAREKHAALIASEPCKRVKISGPGIPNNCVSKVIDCKLYGAIADCLPESVSEKVSASGTNECVGGLMFTMVRGIYSGTDGQEKALTSYLQEGSPAKAADAAAAASRRQAAQKRRPLKLLTKLLQRLVARV